MPGGRKTRQGCARCKEKKVKCDESKPSCQRCVRSKQTCPGYNRPLRWSSKHETLGSTSQNVAINTNQTGILQRTIRWQNDDATPAPAESQPTMTDIDAAPTQHNLFFDDSGLFLGSITTSEFGDHNSVQRDFLSFDHQDEQFDALYDLGGEACLPALPESDNPLPLSGAVQERPMSYPSNLSSQRIGGLVLRPSSTFHHERNVIWPVLTRSEDTLVEYYFKEVATIYSCYDGDMNPFRSTISTLWTTSGLIAKTLQSMAAACLAPEYPSLAMEGLRLRNEVSETLQNSSGVSEPVEVTLLVTIMLGQTAGWHDPKDLGIAWYHRARALFNHFGLTMDGGHRTIFGKDVSFYTIAIEYWEMLFAFVQGKQSLPPLAPRLMTEFSSSSLIEPHPWALVAPGLLRVVRQVGELVWENRTMFHHRKFYRNSDLVRSQEAINHSRDLEKQLLEYSLPLESDILDPQDESTPVAHMLTVGQAYIYVALLQIYRVFPDVLFERMELQGTTDMHPLYRLHDELPLDSTSEIDRGIWLRNLTSNALNLIKSIPLESHTRCVQPFLLIALSSEIGPIRPTASTLPTSHMLSTVGYRRFIRGRLESFRHLLPPKPAQCRLDLVLEIWDTLDKGKEDVYWLDVVIQKGWHYLFG